MIKVKIQCNVTLFYVHGCVAALVFLNFPLNGQWDIVLR